MLHANDLKLHWTSDQGMTPGVMTPKKQALTKSILIGTACLIFSAKAQRNCCIILSLSYQVFSP